MNDSPFAEQRGATPANPAPLTELTPGRLVTVHYLVQPSIDAIVVSPPVGGWVRVEQDHGLDDITTGTFEALTKMVTLREA